MARLSEGAVVAEQNVSLPLTAAVAPPLQTGHETAGWSRDALTRGVAML